MRSWPGVAVLLLTAHTGAFAGAGSAQAEPGAASPSAAPTAAALVQLGVDLGQAIPRSGSGDDRWGVLVVSLDGGDTLFSHEAETALTPASNMKLFTSAAALHYLGPDYRYTTYLTATGPIRDGVLEGDLVVYGTGDPTFSRRFAGQGTDIWETLADSLAAAGVRRVAGDLVGDGSFFEGPPVGAGWQTAYVTHAYAAPAGALSYNENVVSIRVRPGPTAGSPPRVQLLPGGAVELNVEVATVASGRSWIEVERESYASPIVVVGQIQRGHAGLWRATPVVDPAHFAASAFAQALARRGIEVTGGVRAMRDAALSPVGGRRTFAPALDGAPPVHVLAVHRSPPMLEILAVVNQRSHNLYAESVLRVVGRVAMGSGSAAGGAAAVARMMEEGGASAATLAMDDGSGLSRLNRASPRSIVDLLAIMAASPHADAFAGTLPEAATSRGLRRMQRTPAAGNLRAKTGTIEGVSALSGYVSASNGERLAFAIISNDVRSTHGAKRIEDRIGARLAAFDRPAPSTDLPDRPGRIAARAPAPAPPELEAPDQPAEADPEPATASYTIQRGDTLEGIARRHGVSIDALRTANPGVRDRRLMPGQTLAVPVS